MKMFLIGLAAATLVAGPAAAGAKRGGTVYDVEGKVIGKISRVLDGGALSVIVHGRTVVIPAQSLSEAQGKVKTSMSRAQVRKL